MAKSTDILPHVLAAASGQAEVGRRRADHRFEPGPFHWHATTVLTSGSMRLVIGDGKRDVLLAPCAVLIQAGTAFTIDIPPATEYVWFEWGTAPRKRVAREGGGRAKRYAARRPQPFLDQTLGAAVPTTLPDSLFDGTHRAAREIAACWWRTDALIRFRATAALWRWFETLIAHYQPRTPGASLGVPNDAIAPLIRVAESHLAAGLTVQKWADACGIGRHTLNHRLQQTYGLTASAALDRIRLDLAQRHLRDPTQSIRATAAQIGMRYDTFRHWFRRHVGLSAAQWRRQERGV